MTRINLVPVQELADQHLMAEYREIPRMAAFAAKTKKTKNDIPMYYRLGTGHMIFFLDKAKFLEDRHKLVKSELLRRGFNLRYTDDFEMPRVVSPQEDDWSPIDAEIQASRDRIEEKLAMKPEFYKWSIPE